MRKTYEIVEEIAADYFHLAQDADGKMDATRRRRFKWLMNLVKRLRKTGL